MVAHLGLTEFASRTSKIFISLTPGNEGDKPKLGPTSNSNFGISSGLIAPTVLAVSQYSRRYEPAAQGTMSDPLPK